MTWEMLDTFPTEPLRLRSSINRASKRLDFTCSATILSSFEFTESKLAERAFVCALTAPECLRLHRFANPCDAFLAHHVSPWDNRSFMRGYNVRTSLSMITAPNLSAFLQPAGVPLLLRTRARQTADLRQPADKNRSTFDQACRRDAKVGVTG